MISYANTETTVKTWLTTTTVAALVTRPGGGINVFNAMPKGAPLPAVVLYQSSGGPSALKDLPEQAARIRFDCWAASRAEASSIALQICAELDNLQRSVGPIVDGVYLAATSSPTMFFLPDPDSDTPRYIVSALVVTVA
jgi:hypothetical protein